MGIHQRGQLGQKQPADVVRSRWPCSMLVNLARLVFSQSLLGVDVGGEPQIADHRIDVVL
jgi:hypothetical protein